MDHETTLSDEAKFAAKVQAGKTASDILQLADGAAQFLTHAVQQACAADHPPSDWQRADDNPRDLRLPPYRIIIAPNKSSERIHHKLASHYGANANENTHGNLLTDYVRLTLVPDTLADRNRMMDQLTQMGMEYHTEPLQVYEGGFRNDSVLLALPEGVVGEVKIMAPAQYRAYQTSHTIYELARPLTDGRRQFAPHNITDAMRTNGAFARDFNAMCNALQEMGYSLPDYHLPTDTPLDDTMLETALRQLKHMHRLVHMKAAEQSAPDWRAHYIALAAETNARHIAEGNPAPFPEAWLHKQHTELALLTSMSGETGALGSNTNTPSAG